MDFFGTFYFDLLYLQNHLKYKYKYLIWKP